MAAGRLEDILIFHRGPKTKIINLRGRTMLPGFVEPHVHCSLTVLDDWLNLGPFVNKDMDEIEKKLESAV